MGGYKMRRVKGVLILVLLWGVMMCVISCTKSSNEQEDANIVKLVWYQIGSVQKDEALVLEKVNEYIREKIGVELEIKHIDIGDYNQKIQTIINTESNWDICFTSSWVNDYFQNVEKGVFYNLEEFIKDTQMYEDIDPRFWKAMEIEGAIYGIPSEKELGNMPVWIFTKEYVDKYNIPYESIHTLEDLEPWLEIIKENEPDVIPMYLARYTAPTYMDKIVEPIGIEYGDDTYTVKNVFETERMQSTLQTTRRYYEKGYINADAATISDTIDCKRFVVKGDGQPFSELIFKKELGYEVVISPIMESCITNASARGAINAINAKSKNPKKAVELLDLIHKDLYLRNLLNYGIEGIHWEAVEVSDEELEQAKGKPYIYDKKVHLISDKYKDYSVIYWAQGGLFNTYVLEDEPIDKWASFEEFNSTLKEAPTFGIDFELDQVKKQVNNMNSIMEEYGKAIYTGTVDPDVYVPKLLEILEKAGISEVIDEFQKQLDKESK